MFNIHIIFFCKTSTLRQSRHQQTIQPKGNPWFLHAMLTHSPKSMNHLMFGYKMAELSAQQQIH